MADGATKTPSAAATVPATEGLPLELQILELFGDGVLILGPTDVERATGVSKGVASPKLRRLAEAGFLVGVGPGQYEMGPRTARLYTRYMTALSGRLGQMEEFWRQALGPIREMVAELGKIVPDPPASRKGGAA